MAKRNVKLKNRSGDYLYPYTENIPTASTSTAGKVKLDSSPTSGSNNAITSGAVYTALNSVNTTISGLQNDVGNKYSPTIIAVAITSKLDKAKLPTHIEVGRECGLETDSVILMEQIRTLDKRRLKQKIGILDEHKMEKANNALLISLGFYQNLNDKVYPN